MFDTFMLPLPLSFQKIPGFSLGPDINRL